MNVKKNEKTKTTRKKGEKKPLSKKQKVAILIAEAVVLIILIIAAYAFIKWNKIDHETKLDVKEARVNQELDSETVETMTGYRTIALFGLDNREGGNYKSGNSDSIMIASINNETGEVKIVSVYRDTILQMRNKDDENVFRKANAAYASGGAVEAVAMLNENLDLSITDYVCVDWVALVKAIDALGGLDLTLSAEEVELTNYNLPEVDETTGYKTPNLTGSGQLHLDGTQALCYARIRKTAGDDFLRASRQRIVIQAMIDKAKGMSVADLNNVIDEVAPLISMTLNLRDIVSMLPQLASMNMGGTTGFPVSLGIDKNFPGSGDSVVACTLELNVAELHAFLFEEENYTPSNMVKTISAEISEKSNNCKTPDDAIDISRYNLTGDADGTDFKNEQ